MDQEKPPLDAALRHLAELKRQSLASHPTPQELAAYHAGELPPEAESRLLDHLAVCRDCSDLLLDLAGFADLKPPAGVPELTDEQVEEDWQELRTRMSKEAAPLAEVVPIRPAGPAAKPERMYPLWLPVAASLLAVLGFSFGLYQSVQVGELERQLQTFEQPRSVLTRHLESGVRRSQREEEIERPLSSQTEEILFLYPDTEQVFPHYEADVAGRTISIAPPPSPDEPISLLIPPGFLKPGGYQLLLFGVDGNRREKAGAYSLQVNDP